jgi:replicative DNA helicase
MNTMLQWAQWYHSRGMHVMPIEPRGKRPILASWSEYFDKQPTLEEVERWWTNTPDANIGLIQGRGQFVLDIDDEKGEAALAAAGIVIPENTPQVKTRKGRHIYFTGVVPNSAGSIFEKVDTRSDHGYVVAPPSVHESGHVYTWTCDLWPPKPAPENLIAAFAKQPDKKAFREIESWIVDAMAGVGEGQRDVMAARIAGYYWGKSLPEEVVHAILSNWAELCTPPFPADEVEKVIKSICKREGGPQALPEAIADVMGKTMGQIFAPKDKRPPVASTSITALDQILDGGFYPGDYVLLASRPSVGKSALALQIARESALKGAGVLIVSLEMSSTALTRRMLVQESGIPMSVLKTGEGMTEMIQQALWAAAARIDPLPIWITTSVESGEDLLSTVEAFEPGVLRLVIVDYLQIMSAGDRDGRQRVEHVSKCIKRTAIKFNVPVLALSSLSRPPRELDSWRPELRDLRESGELEHDADIVLMMYRDLAAYIAEIYVRKQRDGKVDAAPIRTVFDGARQTFREEKA